MSKTSLLAPHGQRVSQRPGLSVSSCRSDWPRSEAPPKASTPVSVGGFALSRTQAARITWPFWSRVLFSSPRTLPQAVFGVRRGREGRTDARRDARTDGGCKRPPHLPATGAQSRCRPACAGPPASGRSRPCPAGAAGAARRCSGRSSRPPPPPGPAPPGSGKPARTEARGNTDPTHTGRAGRGPRSGPAVALAVRFTSPNLSALLCFLFFVFLNF